MNTKTWKTLGHASAWCVMIVGPMSEHWPFFCKLLGWGVLFPGKGW